MKKGFRSPSPRRSISARTTGRVTRTIKKATNPLYGKKGMGYINNPQKAVYNKVYNKTTFGLNDMVGNSLNDLSASYEQVGNDTMIKTKKQRPRWLFYFHLAISIFILICDIFMANLGSVPVWCILLSIVCFVVTVYYGVTTRKKAKAEYEPSHTCTSKDNIPSDELIKINVTSETVRNPQCADLIENALKQHEEYIATSNNPKWHRTTSEKRSFSDFSLKYRNIIKGYESQIYNNGKIWDNDIDVDSRIAACKNSIAAFDTLKEFCYSHGGEIYFQDMWEHCHNSKEECFSQGDKLKEQLEYLEIHRNDLIYVEQHKPMLRMKFKEYLSQHEGVVQKDIYKDFNSLLKSSIQSELYFMDKEGIIKRTKKGSSYVIELIK